MPGRTTGASFRSPTAEIAYAGKKLKPIVLEDLIMIAELDGEPVAFMMTLPDVNEVLKPMRRQAVPVRLGQAAVVAAQAATRPTCACR